MQKVTIIGLGLIGSSIGLRLRKWATNDGSRNPVLEVTGFDVDLSQQNYSKKIKAVDKAQWNMLQAIDGADLVIVAVPAQAVKDVFETIAPHLKSGAVVTDVTSTKADILAWADEILPSTVSFIGGHPMAGSAQSVEGADADLFNDSTWCVVPSVRADEGAVQTVLGMVNALGAEPLFIDAHEHDGYVAAISHLPMITSVALMQVVSKDPGWRDMKFLTAGGFRDTTRLAAGSVDMHADIAATNRDALVRWIDRYVNELLEIRESIADSAEAGTEDLRDTLNHARDARAEWATQERRGQLVQDTASELSKSTVAEQMGHMFVGGLFRRRGDEKDRSRRTGR